MGGNIPGGNFPRGGGEGGNFAGGSLMGGNFLGGNFPRTVHEAADNWINYHGYKYVCFLQYHTLTVIHFINYEGLCQIIRTIFIICDVLRHLVPSVKFKKRENNHGGLLLLFKPLLMMWT